MRDDQAPRPQDELPDSSEVDEARSGAAQPESIPEGKPDTPDQAGGEPFGAAPVAATTEGTAEPACDGEPLAAEVQGEEALAAPEAAPATEPAGDVPPTVDDGPLEELTLPSSIASLEPLPAGSLVGPDAMLRVEELVRQRGRTNVYRALPVTDAASPMEIELLEAPADHAGLRRTADVLSQVYYPMLPSLQATWEEGGRRYVALEARGGPLLADALAVGMPAEAVISVVLQLTQAIRRLHQAGWTLLGLSPGIVQTSQPVAITQLGNATRIGESPEDALHVAGYSAPELVHRLPVSGQEDVYSLGALLYHGLSGTSLPEEGLQLAALAATVPVPGAPQLLATALGPADERAELDAFYKGLLELKRRLASAPLALRVASGTTVGLNPTRPVNEDACGYLTWTSAFEGHAAYHAVLCAIDGMGGMEAGEEASSAALRAVLREAATHAAVQDAAERARLDPAALVQAAAEGAHAAAAGRQVGATITCAVVEDGRLTLGHVGDTRGYLLRDGVLVRLTRDHSLVAAMVASGVLTDAEARGHPESNKVLRSLGGLRRLPDGYIDGLSAAYGQDDLVLRPDDQILLCSDGVWGVVDDDGLTRILSETPDPEQAVATILQEVLASGAPDNAAAVVARCGVMPVA